MPTSHRLLDCGAVTGSEAEPRAHSILLSQVFDAIPDIVVVIDRDAVIRYANQAAATFLGMSAERLVGECCHALLHSNGGVSDCPLCRNLRSECLPFDAELEVAGRWHRLTVTSLASDTADAQFVQVSRDITAYKEVERALRSNENTHRTLLDHLPQAVFLKDANSVVVSCNRSFSRALDLPLEEIVGKTTYELHPPHLAKQFREEDIAVMAKGELVEFDQHLMHLGKELTVHTLKVPVRDEHGDVCGLLGMSWDVTEKRRAEDALRESQAGYKAILENACDAILIGNAAGRFIDANRRAEELFGYTREEFLSMGPINIHAPENYDNMRRAFLQMNEAGYSLFEHKMLHKNGTVLDVEASGTRIALGDTFIYLGNFRDISQRKRNEEQLRLYREDLERAVEDRTRELKAMNRELESFSYSVSHDLLSPLRAINGFGEALREELSETLSPEANHYLDRMRNATIRMADLIDGLLNLSGVSRSTVRFRVVNLSAAAAAIANQLQESDPQRAVRFDIEPGLTAPGDETLLRVLLQNLLSNAWKFTARTDEARITFGSKVTTYGETFWVSDNGAGFDMRFAHKLFQPFERLHAPDDFRGTGIGLATVRRIVERHGGRVWAEGGVNSGATVFFTLPTPEHG